MTPPATAPKLALRPHLAALRRTPDTPLLRASQPDAEPRHLNLALPNAHLYAARGAKTSVALDADTKLITIGSAKMVLDKSIIRPLLFIAVILGLKVLQVVRAYNNILADMDQGERKLFHDKLRALDRQINGEFMRGATRGVLGAGG